MNDKKVLLVDDNRINLLLLTNIMDKYKIKYDLAFNGKEAYTLFSSANYDLIITDIQMPEMDGLELTRLIRNEADPKKSLIPVIGYTGSITEESRVIYLNNGMNDFLDKPFTENDLTGVLSRVIF